jgi:hypothetical protein
MVTIQRSHLLALFARAGGLAPSLLALLLVVVAAVAIASTYFGHSPSPYGACYRKDGRAVPCELAGQGR